MQEGVYWKLFIARRGQIQLLKKSIINSYLKDFLQIVEEYYVEKIEDKTWFLAGKTVEEVAALVEEYIKKAENKDCGRCSVSWFFCRIYRMG